MTALTLLQPGLMMTVQDRGRLGLLRSGVSRSGPMDASAFAIANALVGNGPAAAALEFAVIGGRLSVDRPVLVAVTGGAVDIRIDGRAVPGWESHRLSPGEVLSIGAMRGAVWGYVAVSGGIDTPPVLGARATHLRTAVGGLDGRVLAGGDVLPLGEGAPGPARRLTAIWRRSGGPVRVIPGPQADHFDAAGWAVFLRQAFAVSSRRDRMATVLEGPPVVAAKGHDIVSDATLAGSIQVPGSGNPIVLMADRQTTGGYPKIATVASVDLPRLAQMVTGARLRFAAIDQAEGEALLLAERKALADAIDSLAAS
ncbi:5-oxoprolinase subunit C family protein [Ensifer soli]|uniref:5-oxoprolinase subunit C family protein n=1 Tax=Ciceribacter sp. sgz301302 TaxID=3342379 RepID=UPI0035BB7B7D